MDSYDEPTNTNDTSKEAQYHMKLVPVVDIREAEFYSLRVYSAQHGL